MTTPTEVTVKAPARLHLGFFDLNGGLGRKFGSFGIALNRPSTKLRLSRSNNLSVVGPEAERGGRHLRTLAAAFGLRPHYRLVIERAIPAHIGFGSGTQLALAIGSAFAALEGVQADSYRIASLLKRGGRSGVGLGAFDKGGVIVDGGRGKNGQLPPVIARLPFPPEWRIMLIFDTAMTGRSGEAEMTAFAGLPPAPADLAAHICRLVLMQALPALAEKDLAGWGDAVAEVQGSMGDYFAPYQNGRRCASPCVAKVLAWLEAIGVKGGGQTSWGPTGFAFMGSSEDAQNILDEARRRWADEDRLKFLICTGRNTGAKIDISHETLRPAETIK